MLCTGYGVSSDLAIAPVIGRAAEFGPPIEAVNTVSSGETRVTRAARERSCEQRNTVDEANIGDR